MSQCAYLLFSRFIRMALGVYLFIKGISFISNLQYLEYLLSPIDKYGGGMILYHYNCGYSHCRQDIDCICIAYG